MVNFYVLEIKLGYITIDQVNKFWRADEMNVAEEQPE